MFKIFKWLVSLIAIIVAIGIVLYLLPRDTKLTIAEKLTHVVPASVKEKTEDLLLTPPEKREKVIRKLAANLSELKKNSTAANAPALITDSETLLNQLEEKNKAQSVGEIIESKLVEKFIGCPVSSTTQSH